eukprot:CAMPEP_0197642472 /NCGR_PEP_ID=MMETSP1338-20131121/16118_1 /TAXON_ID=43686 ORGANISM="Pelagodinium beii, Strain RCC1491" /NCGR_SAMPLE_ID=MMETSP1338 /ASSEMBLY_ACC=CAM_ASM_000754 /LENGTH=246 /DNA_ID=CAMNT_0043215595 /DNA_START=59 /DNA_END=799 /DNA_ORIENTATION=+
MGAACSSETGAVLVEPIGKIKVRFWDASVAGMPTKSALGRGIALAALIELSKADFELDAVPMGQKEGLVMPYLPEVHTADGMKFTELGGIAMVMATSYPNSIIAVKSPKDLGVASMAAIKASEIWNECLPIFSSVMNASNFTQENFDAMKKKEEEYLKPIIASFEGLCSADGKLTSTGTSFGEVVLWWALATYQRAKVPSCTPLPPKMTKLVARINDLPEIQKVLKGDTVFGSVFDLIVPIPDKFK